MLIAKNDLIQISVGQKNRAMNISLSDITLNNVKTTTTTTMFYSMCIKLKVGHFIA